MEGGHELRQRRHLDAQRDEGADGAADDDARGDDADSSPRPGEARVVAMAITMPAMPKRLPPREVSGEDRPRSAMMKQTAATR